MVLFDNLVQEIVSPKSVLRCSERKKPLKSCYMKMAKNLSFSNMLTAPNKK